MTQLYNNTTIEIADGILTTLDVSMPKKATELMQAVLTGISGNKVFSLNVTYCDWYKTSRGISFRELSFRDLYDVMRHRIARVLRRYNISYVVVPEYSSRLHFHGVIILQSIEQHHNLLVDLTRLCCVRPCIVIKPVDDPAGWLYYMLKDYDETPLELFYYCTEELKGALARPLLKEGGRKDGISKKLEERDRAG